MIPQVLGRTTCFPHMRKNYMTTKRPSTRAGRAAFAKISGGRGRKSKLVSPEAQAKWKSNLHRAIVQASGNMMVMKKQTFFTIANIREMWGRTAENDFKSWFTAERHYNVDIADELQTNLIKGLISREKYDKFLYTKAYSWVWAIRPERHREAWEISRGLRTL